MVPSVVDVAGDDPRGSTQTDSLGSAGTASTWWTTIVREKQVALGYVWLKLSGYELEEEGGLDRPRCHKRAEISSQLR